MGLTGRHLLGLEGMPRADIELVLDNAASFREVLERPIRRVPTLQGKTIANLFFESYRTDNVITAEKKLQVHNAVVQYSEERVGAMATYSHFKPFDITLDAGCMIRRDFDFFRAEASATRLAVHAE